MYIRYNFYIDFFATATCFPADIDFPADTADDPRLRFSWHFYEVFVKCVLVWCHWNPGVGSVLA